MVHCRISVHPLMFHDDTDIRQNAETDRCGSGGTDGASLSWIGRDLGGATLAAHPVAKDGLWVLRGHRGRYSLVRTLFGSRG